MGESHYPNAEIHLTEWSSSPSPRDYTHDYLQAATFVVKCNIESAGLVGFALLLDVYGCFEEGGAGDTVFHGGFGMINFQGIPKPTFHAYRLLACFGDETIHTGPGSIVTRHPSTGKLTALAYHYPDEVKVAVPNSMGSRDTARKTLATGTASTLAIDLSGLAPGSHVVVETLGGNSGNAMGIWTAMENPIHCRASRPPRYATRPGCCIPSHFRWVSPANSNSIDRSNRGMWCLFGMET